MAARKRTSSVHRVTFYAVLFDGFLAPKVTDYPLVDHIEYGLRRAWPRGRVRRYMGEVKLRGVADLAFEEVLRLLESGPTVIDQLHIIGYSVGAANAIRFCERLAELPVERPIQPATYRLHPGLMPEFLGGTEAFVSSAWRPRPLTSLAVIDFNAHSRSSLGLGVEETPAASAPVQQVLHLRSVHGPRRGLMDGRGLPVEFPHCGCLKELYFGGHHGLFPLEGGRPALSVDDEAPMAGSAEEALRGAGKGRRPSQSILEFVSQAARRPRGPTLASADAPVRAAPEDRRDRRPACS